MGAENVVLRLVLDAAGAKQEAAGTVQALDNLKQHAAQVASDFQNTLRGRLLTGLASTVKEQMGTLFNTELPAQLRAQEVGTNLVQAGIKALLPVGGDTAAAVFGQVMQLGQGANTAGMKGAMADLQQLQAVFPGEALDPNDVNALAPELFNQHKHEYDVSRQLRMNFARALPSKDYPIWESKEFHANIDEAVEGLPTEFLRKAGRYAAGKVSDALPGFGF